MRNGSNWKSPLFEPESKKWQIRDFIWSFHCTWTFCKKKISKQWFQGPPFDSAGTAVYFHAFNRNKKSVALDFSKPEGRKVMEQLVAESDIFTENYIPGKLAKYGLSYDDLKKINPNIIYASLSGEGFFAPWSSFMTSSIVSNCRPNLWSQL